MSEGNRLSDMDFDEISLVTRPANQLSKVVLYKGDIEMPDSEEVLEDPNHSVTKADSEEYVEEEEEEEEEEVEKTEREAMLEYIDTLEVANDELLAKLEGGPAISKRDELLKSADPAIVQLIKSAEDRASAAEAIAKSERDHRVEREFIAKAAEFENLSVTAEDLGPVLKAAAERLEEDDYTLLNKVLTSANEVIASGETFNEIGRSASFDSEEGMGRIEQVAKTYQATDPSLTREAAISKAVSEDPTLYDSYLKETN
jgi:hypothetical protein